MNKATREPKPRQRPECLDDLSKEYPPLDSIQFRPPQTYLCAKSYKTQYPDARKRPSKVVDLHPLMLCIELEMPTTASKANLKPRVSLRSRLTRLMSKEKKRAHFATKRCKLQQILGMDSCRLPSYLCTHVATTYLPLEIAHAHGPEQLVHRAGFSLRKNSVPVTADQQGAGESARGGAVVPGMFVEASPFP